MIKKAAFICLLLLVINSMTFCFAAENVIYGDADGNGSLTANDSAVILQKVLNNSYNMPIESKTHNYLQYIDVNCDSILTAADAAEVLQKVLV